MENKPNLPIAIHADIEEKCAGCPALKTVVKQAELSIAGAVAVVEVSISCENKKVCEALEQRRWDAFIPCDPGADLFFINGQTGRVTEVAFDTEDYALIRCVKYIGNDSYDASFRATELGKTVFLDIESCEEAMQKEVPNEKHSC